MLLQHEAPNDAGRMKCVGGLPSMVAKFAESDACMEALLQILCTHEDTKCVEKRERRERERKGQRRETQKQEKRERECYV